MTQTASIRTPKPSNRNRIADRLGLLRARHSDLDAEVAVEAHRTRPDMFRVQFLKRARLRTKDEITYLSGLLRTLSRPADKSAA
ncbi:MAG: YdcH family protein [Pseudomonadota bacterium]